MRAFVLFAGWCAVCVAACTGDLGGTPGDATSAGQTDGATAASDASTVAGVGGAGVGGAGGASGAGGLGGAPAGTASASSSSSGGSGDPCAGQKDGDHCGGDLGGEADHNSVYTCAGGVTKSTKGCQYGCANATCKSPPADPCASAMYGDGAYCGGSLAGGDANALYQCKGGKTASKQTCPNGCQVQPPNVPDVCKSGGGDPCAKANSGDGAYCGSTLGAGDPATLYQCKAMKTASSMQCPNGCQQNPPNVPDACKSGGGGCCLQHPPGVITQSYSACGNGGSHYGIDYGTPIGTPIYAGMTGTVVGSALGFPNCYNNGCTNACYNSFNYVKIKADCGDPKVAGHDYYIYYLHINGLAPGVGNGTHVTQGQLVAYSGNSGCSSGPHIHIETVSVAGGGNATLSTCNSVNPASRYCN